ncbi:54S ribosomal protein YmL6 [Lophiostoma macrostomum CBS 122681]|uniref:Large ribosomal subunit protein uL4m n=1 Tax=Lophiostoma macrostomum CBS 122681 TaxID=1314788 RepID=A0A6A6TIJ7_9PLEO|nr:54S ribosomal protein YmL6 [Lophiostoma macrostomum CBS 122681]
MASNRIPAAVRSLTSELSGLSIRREASRTPSLTRTITTSARSHASITTSPNPSIIPFEDQTVTTTVYNFPQLEPLYFKDYPATFLNLPTRRDILHRAVVFEGDAARAGTASTKWRSEVRGSARKIRPQKGTGKARLGDKKSPMLRGGGRAFGPKPRDFSTELPRKVYDLAWRTALSYRFQKGELVVINRADDLEAPSPMLLKHILDRHSLGREGGKSLLITHREREDLANAFAELPREGRTLPWWDVDVKDLLELGKIVIERRALNLFLEEHLEGKRMR